MLAREKALLRTVSAGPEGYFFFYLQLGKSLIITKQICLVVSILECSLFHEIAVVVCGLLIF